MIINLDKKFCNHGYIPRGSKQEKWREASCVPCSCLSLFSQIFFQMTCFEVDLEASRVIAKGGQDRQNWKGFSCGRRTSEGKRTFFRQQWWLQIQHFSSCPVPLASPCLVITPEAPFLSPPSTCFWSLPPSGLPTLTSSVPLGKLSSASRKCWLLSQVDLTQDFQDL